jgi:hypothetical protein
LNLHPQALALEPAEASTFSARRHTRSMEHASKCLRDYRGGANQGALIRGVLVEHNNALMGLLSTTTAASAPAACPCGPQLTSAHASIALLKIQLQELSTAFAELSAAFSAPAELPADDAPAPAPAQVPAQVLQVLAETEPAEKCAPLAVAAVVASVVVPIAVAAISSKPEADAVQVGAVATSVSPSKKSESVSASSDDHEAQQELIAQQMAALMESDDAHSSDRLESISVRRMATAQQVVALSKQHRALGKTAARKTKAKAPK